MTFLIKDAFTFILALFLDITFLVTVEVIGHSYGYTVVSALGNGISCFVLYLQNAMVVGQKLKNKGFKGYSGGESNPTGSAMDKTNKKTPLSSPKMPKYKSEFVDESKMENVKSEKKVEKNTDVVISLKSEDNHGQE